MAFGCVNVALHQQNIQGGPKLGIQYTVYSKSTIFVLYLSSLPSFTIPVKKKKITVYLLLAQPVYNCSLTQLFIK